MKYGRSYILKIHLKNAPGYAALLKIFKLINLCLLFVKSIKFELEEGAVDGGEFGTQRVRLAHPLVVASRDQLRQIDADRGQLKIQRFDFLANVNIPI